MLNFSTENTKIWRLNELERIIDDFEDSLGDYVNYHNIKKNEEYLNIVLDITGKSIVTFREIICLSTCGYSDGALSLARNLCEQFFILAFFEKKLDSSEFQNYVDDYYLDYEIQCIKIIKKNTELFDKNKSVKLDKEFQALKQKSTKRINGNYWWAGIGSFKELCKKVKANEESNVQSLINDILMAYNRACVSLHSSCLGNSIRLSKDKDFVGIDTSPRLNGHNMPLWLSSVTFIWIMAIANKEIMGITKYSKEINDLAAFYSKKMKDEYKDNL